MLALGLLACLIGLVRMPQQDAPPRTEPLAGPAVRQKVRGVVREIAKTGDALLVTRMRAVLAGLGEEEEELASLADGWQRMVVDARPTKSTRTAAAIKLRRELEPLVEELRHESEPRRAELARWVLELDSEQPEANAAAGRERDTEGEWLTGEERAWKWGARRVAGFALAAGKLDFDVDVTTSANPVLKMIGGGHVVRAKGIELHGRLAPDVLARILLQALRAAALSNAVMRDRLELPQELQPWKFVLLDGEEAFGQAVEEAREAKSIAAEDLTALRDLGLRSFLDARGWRTSRWRSEADFEAMVLWEAMGDWLGKAQPCLRVGHLNWVCLSFLGSSIPIISWREQTADAERTTARASDGLQRESLWRSTRQSLYGCRAWMIGAVREERDPPWVRAMLEHDGKIRDESLLKTTLVCELLQQEGRLWELVQATRAKTPVPAAIEKALGEPLAKFEARWRRWLDPPSRAGVLQELEHGAPTPAAESPFEPALRMLVQARLNAMKGQFPEIQTVVLDPDLSRGAELHARYLTLNPEQKTRWPAAHEERADAPGFTPAGSLSGARAVIAFEREPVKALEGWLGTFYHRLPLLDPGLFGVGFGASEEVLVLDVRSLVLAPWRDHVILWPLPDAENVPRGFRPELPNPVPEADMATLGYPISVQLFFKEAQGRTTLQLELFTGEPAQGHAVDCHVITPEAPLQVEYAPENVWGLIPKRVLEKETRYTVRATWAERVEQWRFTTGS